jgi:hypothetical protein
MNTNQYMMNINTAPYWNPVILASNIQRTPSFESLSKEEQLKRRLDRMETAVNDCNYIINSHNKSLEKFNKRINDIISNCGEHMIDFYEESPDFEPDCMVDTLIWLTYSNEEKKDILDKELEEYFN